MAILISPFAGDDASGVSGCDRRGVGGCPLPVHTEEIL